MTSHTTTQWTLPTAAGEYTVSMLPDRSGLVLDHWGAALGGTPEWSEPTRQDEYHLFADSAPLEYAAAGQRHVTFSELKVDHGDSLTGTRWQCSDLARDVAFDSGPDGAKLSVAFIDDTARLRLTLHMRTSTAHDIVERWVGVENLSADRTVTLPRVFSAAWNLPVGQRARVEYLAGTWAQEFTPQSLELPWGTFTIGSRTGVTGHNFSPVVTVHPGLGGRAGEAYGIALAWSGSWRLQAEASPVSDRVRVSCGVDDDLTTITLQPGEQFVAPSSLGTWSPDGAEGVSRAWHRYQRSVLARSLDPRHRPIVYNSWYATEFDIRVDHQLALAEIARHVGAEIFVIDDGWFVGRVDDTAGLGDWRVDTAKFPDGLGAFAETVIATGMRFGLWIEPEAVNPDSDLFRAHPDWVYRAQARPLVTRRNQYVLDLGREEVVAWIEDTFRELLGSLPISYIKWDMNRPVSDGGRPGDVHGRQWSVQHAEGYYRVMRMLRREFPEVTIETCAAGGGRIDNASLALSDVVWPSDETGPRDRLGIQHGFLSAYPPHVMSSWVTDDAGLHDRSAVSFGFRFVVAMSGVLGIGADLVRWTPEQVTQASEWVDLYRSIRHVIHTGEVRRHGAPGDTTYALEYSDPADGSGTAVVLVYDRDRDREIDLDRLRVRPLGLVADRTYRLRSTGELVTGAAAAALGVAVPFQKTHDADVLVFDPVN